MIADVILKVAAEEGKQEPTAYFPRPSSAGPERCIRSMVYHGLNFPREPLPGRAVMIFSDSSFHEDLTGDWIRKSAFRLHSEQMHFNVFSPHLSFLPARKCRALVDGKECGADIPAGCLAGHVDGIVTDLFGTDAHWEHKAVNHFGFQRYWAGDIPMDYVTQCCLCQRGIHEVNPDVHISNLLIKNKNTAQYMEFNIDYNPTSDMAVILERVNSQGEHIEMGTELYGVTEYAFEKFATVQDYISRKTLPKRQYDLYGDNSWQCEYCAYGKTCWDNYEKEFEEMKTDAMLPGEIETMLRYYKELGGQKSDIEKEYKALRSKIVEMMKEIDVREGRAGEYAAKLTRQEKELVDKTLLTTAELEKARKISVSEVLRVSKPKAKKEAA